MIARVSWTEVWEAFNSLEKDGLTLLVRRRYIDPDTDHRILVFVAPQMELEVDIDTTLSVPHRGGLQGAIREQGRGRL